MRPCADPSAGSGVGSGTSTGTSAGADAGAGVVFERSRDENKDCLHPDVDVFGTRTTTLLIYAPPPSTQDQEDHASHADHARSSSLQLHPFFKPQNVGLTAVLTRQKGQSSVSAPKTPFYYIVERDLNCETHCFDTKIYRSPQGHP